MKLNYKNEMVCQKFSRYLDNRFKTSAIMLVEAILGVSYSLCSMVLLIFISIIRADTKDYWSKWKRAIKMLLHFAPMLLVFSIISLVSTENIRIKLMAIIISESLSKKDDYLDPNDIALSLKEAMK